MGVTGLWQLIESVGTPVKVDKLEGKRLGVDANIWLYKFIRGFREGENYTNLDAHKLGLFNRICKLLFYKIKPVFVFDGPAPVLKRRTLDRRRNVRNKHLEKVQDAAMRLLADQLKGKYPDMNLNKVMIKLPQLKSNHLVAAEKFTNEDRDLFYLPPKPEGQEEPEQSEQEEEDGDEEVQEFLDPTLFDPTRIDIKSQEFSQLPAEIRYETLQDVKESRRKIRRVERLPEDASSFSSFQLGRLLSRRFVQEKIEECEKEIQRNFGSDGRGQVYISNKASFESQNPSSGTSSQRDKVDLTHTETNNSRPIIKPPDTKLNHLEAIEKTTKEVGRIIQLSPELEVQEKPDQSEDVEVKESTLTDSSPVNVTSQERFINEEVELSCSSPEPEDQKEEEQQEQQQSEEPKKVEAQERQEEEKQEQEKEHEEEGDDDDEDEDDEELEEVQELEETEDLEEVDELEEVEELVEVSEEESDVEEVQHLVKDATEPDASKINVESQESPKQSLGLRDEALHDIEKPRKEIPLVDLLAEDVTSSNVESDRSHQLSRKVTSKIIEEAQELLRMFGVPFIVATGEAEAQCAALEKLKLTEGTITDDSDIWLFGARNVYRHFFNDKKNQAQLYKMADIEAYAQMNREKMVCLAMLVGSDYTDGVMNVGPVTATKILSEFPGQNLEPLIKFKQWRDEYASSKDKKVGNSVRKGFLKYRLPESFPSESVFDAYLNPAVDPSSEQFTWGTPDLDELREYVRRNFGWSSQKADDTLLPVIKRVNESRRQLVFR